MITLSNLLDYLVRAIYFWLVQIMDSASFLVVMIILSIVGANIE